MTSDVADRWIRLRHPEHFQGPNYEALQQRVDKALADIAQRANAYEMTPEEYDRWVMRERMKRMLEEYDTSVLDALGMTLDDLVEARKQAMSRSRGGAKRSDLHQQCLDIALQAFLEAEQDGEGFTEAASRAGRAIEREKNGVKIPRETINGWLKEIAGKPWSSIPAPARGRPKKSA